MDERIKAIRNYDRLHGIGEDGSSDVLGVDLLEGHYVTRTEDYGDGTLVTDDVILPSRVWKLIKTLENISYFVENTDRRIIEKVEIALYLRNLRNLENQ